MLAPTHPRWLRRSTAPLEACDPAGTSDAAAEFLERIEDRDEPVTAHISAQQGVEI